MKNKLIIGLALSSLTLSFAPAMAVEEEMVVESATCSNGKEERKLDTVTKGAGCLANYTKAGKSSSIANSRNGVELCREKMRALKDKLVKSGFNCK